MVFICGCVAEGASCMVVSLRVSVSEGRCRWLHVRVMLCDGWGCVVFGRGVALMCLSGKMLGDRGLGVQCWAEGLALSGTWRSGGWSFEGFY